MGSDTDMVDTTAVDTTAVDTDTTTARGLLMPNPRPMLMLPLMPTMDTTAVDTVMAMDTDTVGTMVDTMAVDTDMVTDTDITVKLLLKLQIFKAIFPPIIELSIYQTRLPPPPYIHPEKSEKY